MILGGDSGRQQYPRVVLMLVMLVVLRDEGRTCCWVTVTVNELQPADTVATLSVQHSRSTSEKDVDRQDDL